MQGQAQYKKPWSEQCQGRKGVGSYSHRLWSSWQEVQDPVIEESFVSLLLELQDELRGQGKYLDAGEEMESLFE